MSVHVRVAPIAAPPVAPPAVLPAALLLAALLLALGAVPAPAQAQGLRFGTLPAPAPTLAPDSEAAVNATLAVRCRKVATSWFATFSTGQSGSFAARRASGAGSTLVYQIYDSTAGRNVLKDLSGNPSAAEVLAGAFAYSTGWSTQNVPFVVVVPSGQLPPPGQYTDTINLSLYSGTLASPGGVEDTASFVVTVTVAASLDVSLVPAGAPFNIAASAATFDFGTIAPGTVRVGDIVVRSNGSYSLTVTSLAGGVLEPADLADPSSVPYTLSANGVPITLSPGVAAPVAAGAAATGFAGTRYALSAGITSTHWATEGVYSDVLTFQATAN